MDTHLQVFNFMYKQHLNLRVMESLVLNLHKIGYNSVVPGINTISIILAIDFLMGIKL